MNKQVFIDALVAMLGMEAMASEEQGANGNKENGRRGEVLAGSHLDPLADAFRQEFLGIGVKPENIFTDRGNLAIPGWFRRDKKWDLVAYGTYGLACAIELKSILSSYGNNTNNRIEEALGTGIDAFYAGKNGLYSLEGERSYPPAFGYVMVIGDDEKSRAQSAPKELDPRVKPDPIFGYTSYVEKHAIALKRMVREKIYDAAWLVAIDYESATISEPDPSLSLEKFWEIMSAKIKVSL